MDPFDVLIQGQYANRIRLLRQAGGQYFGTNFSLSNVPTDWILQLGRYPGRWSGHPVDIHGYWIFRGDGARQCWQAVNRGGGPLAYWNADGRAQGNPEDWELFTFETVSAPDRTVKILNAAYMVAASLAGGHPNPRTSPCYIGLTGTQFACNETQPNAAIFSVEFP